MSANGVELSLGQFEGTAFDAKPLIEKLSESFLKGKKVNAELDVSGLVGSFEDCVKRITKMRKQVNAKLDDLEDAQKAVESKRHEQLCEISDKIDSVQKKFTIIEQELAKNGYNVIRIGEQLESLDLQRTKATETKELLDYYSELCECDSSRLEALQSTGLSGLGKVAIIARRLNEISHEVDKITPKSLQFIEKQCENLEQKLLSMFDRAYTQNDTAEMAQLARILYDFNGGHSCIQAYVNQHALFAANGRLAGILSHYSAKSPKQMSESRISTVTNYYSHIAESTLTAWSNVKIIFPNSNYVMHVFIQRVFAQLVQPFVEVVCPIDSLQSLEFLQVLAMVHHATLALADKLRVVDSGPDSDIAAGSKLDAHTREPSTGAGKGVTGFVVGSNSFQDDFYTTLNSVSSLLDRSIDETFLLYTDCGRYIAAENRALENIATKLLQRFNAMLAALRQQTQRGKVSFFDCVKQAPKANTFDSLESVSLADRTDAESLSSLASPAMSAGTESTAVSPDVKAVAPLSPAKKPKKDIATAVGNELKRLLDDESSSLDADDIRELSEQVSIVSLSTVRQLMCAQLEAVERCAELSHASDFAPNFMLLLQTLLENLGEHYLENAILIIQEEMALFDPKFEPDFRCDVVLSVIMQAIQLMKAFFEQLMQPALQLSQQGQREFLVASVEFLNRMETMLNNVISKQCDNCLKYIATLLSKQKKNDFKLKDQEGTQAQLLSSPGTPAISALVTFLAKVKRIAQLCYGEVQPLMFAAVMKEIGGGLLAHLLEHYKNFAVTETGALLLCKDVNRILEAVNSWKLPTLNARFELLKHISTLFMVKAENWRSIFLEGPLARFDISTLIPYLELRSDWDRLEKLENLKHT